MNSSRKSHFLKRMNFLVPIGLIVLILLGIQCPLTQAQSYSKYQMSAMNRNYWPTEDWRVSTPEEQGMDSAILKKIISDISDYNWAIDSVIVIRHGYIVLENYTHQYTQSVAHTIQSCTKSVVSALIGIAIDKGFIQNVSQRVIDFFPNATIQNMDTRKQNITIENCLTMTMGMEWHETDIPYSDPANDLFAMYRSNDMWKYVLDRPMVSEPGKEWYYNSGGVELLAGILEHATGHGIIDFAREFLFEPIGIESFSWWRVPASEQYGASGGLYLTPRDMARFGYLFLNNGTWSGTQIISSDWVQRSTEVYYSTGWYDYGYLWWMIPDTGVYEATGHYEQKIYVIPEDDIVVVFTGNVADEAYHPTDYFVMDYVIPSLTPMSSNIIFPIVFYGAIIVLPLILVYWKYRVLLGQMN